MRSLKISVASGACPVPGKDKSAVASSLREYYRHLSVESQRLVSVYMSATLLEFLCCEALDIITGVRNGHVDSRAILMATGHQCPLRAPEQRAHELSNEYSKEAKAMERFNQGIYKTRQGRSRIVLLHLISLIMTVIQLYDIQLG